MHLALREDAAENARLCGRALMAVSGFSLWKQLPCKICHVSGASQCVGVHGLSHKRWPSFFVFENLAFGVYSSFRYDIFSGLSWNLQWIFSPDQNPNTTLAMEADLVC